MMFISCGGCQGRYAVTRGQKNIFARTSWTPSKSISGVSSHLHCQRQNRNGAQPIPLGLTPKLSSLPGMVPHMRGSLPPSKTHVRKHWPLPPLTWGDERVVDDQLDWSRPVAEEGDLMCLPSLEPHLQELLTGEETFLASTGVEGGPCKPCPPTTPNLPQWKMQIGYSGMLNR